MKVTIKAECQRINAFELWCWRRLLKVPWIAKRSNQSVLKETNPDYLLERLMLKFQSFGHLIRRADSLEKALMLGKIEGRRRGYSRGDREGGEWHHRLKGHEFEETPRDSEGQGSLVCCSPRGFHELDRLSG